MPLMQGALYRQELGYSTAAQRKSMTKPHWTNPHWTKPQPLISEVDKTPISDDALISEVRVLSTFGI